MELEVIERLKEFSVPELCDGSRIPYAMDYEIKPWLGRTKIAGPAVTVDVPAGESGLVAEAIKIAEPGAVLVVAGKKNCATAYWGDQRSYEASVRGVAGVVIDGAFRDLEGCEEEKLPIFARAITCVASGKSGRGAINVPVSCGGVMVRPGDIIAGDCNGVCVVRPEEAEEIIANALEKRRKEAERRKQN